MKVDIRPLLIAPALVIVAMATCLYAQASGGGNTTLSVRPVGESEGSLSANPVVKAIPVLRFDKAHLSVPAEVDVTITFKNEDAQFPKIPHGLAIYESSGEEVARSAVCTAPCLLTVKVNLPLGEYFYRCYLHPHLMSGVIVSTIASP